MIRALINWYKLIRFIQKHRKNGHASFSTVTNGKEIIFTNRRRNRENEEQLRLKFKH